MNKNFLVTTGLVDTWEFSENNFLLSKWCEFYQFNFFHKEKLKKEIPKEINIINNIYHWDDAEKECRDYEYLKKKIEYLLEIISEKLCIIHNVNENKEYWRVIIFTWLSQYTSIIFDRWEIIRIFFSKNKIEKFYTNYIPLNDLEYVPKNHQENKAITMDHEWNHLLYLRLFNFLNIKNLSLIEKKIIKNNLKEKVFYKEQNLPLANYLIRLIKNTISKFAFQFNEVIFDSFYFPKKEFLKICLRCKLIPSKNLNFFDFDIQENSLSKNNKRTELKNLLLKIDSKDTFIKFLLLHLHKDIPKSYVENFDVIKKKILPLAKKKKIIFSMHSLHINDNFKIYIAETKKVGSKFIFATHGGGLTSKKDPDFNFFEKVSDKINIWDNTGKIYRDNTEQKQNIYANLSPTLPIIKLKNPKIGNSCSIIFYELTKYLTRFGGDLPKLDQHFDLFNEITHFVSELNPEIKSKVKFRSKKAGDIFLNLLHTSYDKRFSEMFGKKSIDEHSDKNPYKQTILNSKLIIVTYPHTAFSEAMHSNIPTILVTKKNRHLLTKEALNTFNDLKKNNIAFEDFNEAKIHINKHWKELDLWWKSENVQLARKKFLTNFFNVKPNWYREWSDYIYFSLFNRIK